VGKNFPTGLRELPWSIMLSVYTILVLEIEEDSRIRRAKHLKVNAMG
jgi:hypothetical protein